MELPNNILRTVKKLHDHGDYERIAEQINDKKIKGYKVSRVVRIGRGSPQIVLAIQSYYARKKQQLFNQITENDGN